MALDPADLVIRPLEAQDLDAVVAMERACFEDAWSRESFESEIGDPLIHWPLVAIYRGELIGYMIAWYILDEAHIANICVLPAYRRFRLGRSLIESVLSEGHRRGTKRFDLEVRVSNETARKLYESLGFKVMGVRKRYYADNREDALLMCLRLDSGTVPAADEGEADCPG